MEYVSVEQARDAKGLRLVFTGGLPAPWSEAAKGVLRARNIDFVPVLQIGGGPNEEVLEWTGHRNAPTLMYNDEPPRTTPVGIINYAERVGTGPSLVPDKVDDRIQMFGLIKEIAGESGMAWNARVIMFKVMAESVGEEAGYISGADAREEVLELKLDFPGSYHRYELQSYIRHSS